MASNHGGRGAGADTGRRGRLVLRSGAAAPEDGKRKRPHPGSGAAGGGLKKQKEKSLMHSVCIRDFAHGAVNAIRTHDLILTKDVLYHLSHSSVFNNAKVLYTFYPVFVNCYFIKGGMNCVFCSYRLILSKLAFGFSFKVI